MTETTQKEFNEILEIDKEAFEFNYNKSQMKNALDYFDRFIIKDKGKIIAFVLYKPEKDKMFIRRLAVKKEFRRNSYAQKLVNQIIEKAKKMKLKKVYAFNRVSNLKGIGFFKKMDFKITNEIAKYFSNDEAAYIVEKNL